MGRTEDKDSGVESAVVDAGQRVGEGSDSCGE